jgi:hypothetical protein
MEALGQDEETEIGPNETARKEEVQTKEPQDFKGGGHEEKERHTTQEQEHVATFLATKVEVSKIQPLEVEPQIELVEEEVKIA